MKKIRKELIEILRTLFNDKGLPIAAHGGHYNFCWIRDSYYILAPFLKEDPELYKKGYESLCEYVIGLDKKYDNKLQWLVEDGKKNVDKIRFIHPRFHGDNLEEINAEWGNVQIDTFGYLLLGIAEGRDVGLTIKDSDQVVNTLIDVLKSIEYWNCPDNGIWEENVEVHASSIGAVIGGLHAIREYKLCRSEEIDMLIDKGEETLSNLLPRESETKEYDLALATIACYPFNILKRELEEQIVNDINSNLSYGFGAIRYKGDVYTGFDYEGSMEWCMWFGFAGIYYANNNMPTTARKYLDKLIDIHCRNEHKGIPEGFVSNKPNPNSPLGWACALMIILIDLLHEK